MNPFLKITFLSAMVAILSFDKKADVPANLWNATVSYKSNTVQATVINAQFDKDYEACTRFIKEGVMNKYKYKSINELKKEVRNAISRDYSESSGSQSSSSNSLNVDFLSYFSIGSENNEELNEFKDITSKYRNNSTLNLTDNDFVTIITKVADKKMIDAWKGCIKDYYNSKKIMSLSFSGDIEKDFIANVKWSPQLKSEPNSVKILSVTHTNNLRITGDKNFYKGASITKYSGISQNFERTGNGPASITINLDGYPPLTEDLDGIEEKIPEKPKRITEKKWVNEDELGNKYYEDIYHDIQACVKCDGGKNSVYTDAEFTIADPAGRIYTAERSCSPEQYCAFSYNPNGGYAIDFTIVSNTKIRWRRRTYAGATRETVRIYYQKVREICVQNCE